METPSITIADTDARTTEHTQPQPAQPQQQALQQPTFQYRPSNHPEYFQHPAFPRFPDFLYPDREARDRQISGYLHYVDACGFPTTEIRAALAIMGLSLGDVGLTQWRLLLQRQDVTEASRESIRAMLAKQGARIVEGVEY